MNRSEHQESTEADAEVKVGGSNTTFSFLRNLITFTSGGHDDDESHNELDVHIKISYKTLVFLCVTFAVATRTINALFH